MSSQYLGEIRLFPLSFTPTGWAPCEGQILSISSNQALFSLVGTTYGGNGQNTFALPDLRGRVPVHFSTAIALGAKAGEEYHSLTIDEMPAHTHLVYGSSSAATDVSPQNNVWAAQDNFFGAANSLAAMNNQSISTAGSGQSHSNLQPYLAMQFCIATQGIYPTRN